MEENPMEEIGAEAMEGNSVEEKEENPLTNNGGKSNGGKGGKSS